MSPFWSMKCSSGGETNCELYNWFCAEDTISAYDIDSIKSTRYDSAGDVEAETEMATKFE